jgi:hypothetical protein
VLRQLGSLNAWAAKPHSVLCPALRAVLCHAVQALMERGSPGHYMLGLKILNMLVQEMNQPTPGRTLSTVGETKVPLLY